MDKSPSATPANEPATVPAKTVPKVQKGLFQAAMLIAGVTIASKLLGAVRDWQIITLFGTQLLTDAYYTGFQLPSFALILLGGVGGPFHTATVAVATGLMDNGKPTALGRYVVRWFCLTVVGISALCAVIVYALSEPVCRLMLNAEANPMLVEQAAAQLRLMAAIIVIGPLVGIACGLQNAAQQFFWPSFAPAAMSLTLLVGLWCFAPTAQTLAIATVIGAFAQLAAQLPDLIRVGWFRPVGALAQVDGQMTPKAALKQVLGMVGPAIVGTTAGQLNVYVDIYFTSALPAGGWTAVVQANRLMQLPIGVLQNALLVPVFPRFAQQVQQEDWAGLKATFRLGISSLWVVSLPILAVMWVHGKWLIQLLFERGAFNAQSTQLVFDALLGLSLCLIIYFARDTLTRVFYAFKDTKTPLWIGLAAIVVNIAGDALLVGPLGVKGITLATTIVTLFNGITLACCLHAKHLPNLGWRTMLKDLAALLGLTVLSGAVGYIVLQVALQGWLTAAAPVWLAHLISLLFQLGLQVVGLCWLPVPAARQLMQRVVKSR
jgi:putative peptidoglycan lipid II flippase